MRQSLSAVDVPELEKSALATDQRAKYPSSTSKFVSEISQRLPITTISVRIEDSESKNAWSDLSRK